MTMTPDDKAHLARTVRGLRFYLLGEVGDGGPPGVLHDATESEYRFSVRVQDAGLGEVARARRKRFEGWLAEQARAAAAGKNGGGKAGRTAESFRREVEKQAGYTLLNRLVILRLMEASGLRKPALVTSGWESRAYKDFRELAQTLVGDEAEGFGFLIGLVFDDLAIDLPGLYGSAGVADLVPITAPVWRRCIEALDDHRLNSCWTDDMTLGWIYQYWNDPEREALDAKLNAGGKIEPHEIASKTQMFTERYMVDWLLQNSLGPMWLAMCRKHGWTPEVESSGTLAALEQRRIEWRRKREAGEVSLTDLMPLFGPEEEHWAYYVPQPIPEDAVVHAPESVRDLKILDPAVGSGHFLVVAFDLLVALYREEARHRGEASNDRWGDQSVVESILENNLHGIDLDPRAVQIAAASLWLKAKQISITAHPSRLNLVATNLGLGGLSDDDPAVIELRRKVELESGIPAALTDTIVGAMKGADHIGSLLQVDMAVERAIEQHEEERGKPYQGELFSEEEPGTIQPKALHSKRESLLSRLEKFLIRHSGATDLGLRLHGAQLEAGVRFVHLVRKNTYDIVVANPPYQGTAKLSDARYVSKNYGPAKADLFAAFLIRGLQLTRPAGVSALLTMRNWLFIKQYADLRECLFSGYDLWAIADFDRGAFQEIPDEVVSVVGTIFRRGERQGLTAAIQPTPASDTTRDSDRTARKRAATLGHVGRYDFNTNALKAIPEWPLIYTWDATFLANYVAAPKIGDIAPAKAGLQTANDPRFLRRPWEVARINKDERQGWVPYVKGAAGRQWVEPLAFVLRWVHNGMDIKIAEVKGKQAARPQNESYFFKRGIAISTTGSRFGARLHRFPGIFGDMGRSLFSLNPGDLLCLLNSTRACKVAEALNPTIHFTVGDVNRLPFVAIPESSEILFHLEEAFSCSEASRESSVEFSRPGPSPWRQAQVWAQVAVDRPENAPMPPYAPVYDRESYTDHLSFAFGVAIGRFGASGEGALDPTKDDLFHALPDGVLVLDGTLSETDRHDSLGHTAASPLHEAWEKHSHAIASGNSLRDYLRTRFFGDVHRTMYENRPIHWPLSSEKKTFVAWINIHRFTETTLLRLVANHLKPIQLRFEGEDSDLTAVRFGTDTTAGKEAERQLEKLRTARRELEAFVNQVLQCAEKGPLPTDPKCRSREEDARYMPNLDDGVMINSAALWPLLEPQWKDPKKWWKELANAEGKKDYDWSHLAMRYWPTRVDAKCQKDPSLGVAHGCFWKYHPARAWAWELRLQDEIGPGFRIEEDPYRGDGGHTAHRAAYLAGQLEEALATVESEALRRRRKHKKPQDELHLLENGLWTQAPRLCWDLELRISEKQGSEFFLRAPDEPEARAAFEAANPVEASQRRIRIQNLSPAQIEATPDDAEDPDELDDDGEESDA